MGIYTTGTRFGRHLCNYATLWCCGYFRGQWHLQWAECFSLWLPWRIQSKDPKSWNLSFYISGCERRNLFQCSNDNFLMISIMRFTRAQQHPAVKTIEEVGSRSKTSCQYGMKIAQTTNCVSDLLWSLSYNNGYLIYEGKLVRLWSPSSPNELIGDIHLHISAFDEMGSRSKTKNSRNVAWIIGVLLFLRLIFIVLGVFWRRHSIGVQVDSSLIVFEYKDLHKATKNLLHKKYRCYNLLQQNICCQSLPQQ